MEMYFIFNDVTRIIIQYIQYSSTNSRVHLLAV